MAKRQYQEGIPTELTVAQFEEFVLSHLADGKSCPLKKMNQDVPRFTTHAFTVFFDDGNRTAA